VPAALCRTLSRQLSAMIALRAISKMSLQASRHPPQGLRHQKFREYLQLQQLPVMLLSVPKLAWPALCPLLLLVIRLHQHHQHHHHQCHCHLFLVEGLQSSPA